MNSIEHTKTPTASNPTDGENTSAVIVTSEVMQNGKEGAPDPAVHQENEPSRAATLLGSETNSVIENEIATPKLTGPRKINNPAKSNSQKKWWPVSTSCLPESHRAAIQALVCNPIDWIDEGTGFLECPGIEHHTSPNAKRDCRIKVGGGIAPTITCFHNSCRAKVDKANSHLRSGLGKLTWETEVKSAAIAKSKSEAPGSRLFKNFDSISLPKEAIAEPTISFLTTLFDPDEFVAIYDCTESDQKTAPDGRTKYSPGSGVTRKVSDLISELHAKGGIGNLYPNGLTLFIRANPMRPNGKSDRDVAAYRYVLVDIDKDEHGNAYPLDAQYGALLASKLPLASITYSGDISLAALVRVDAETEAEYKSRKDQVYGRMKLFIKIDDACGNPSRWTRFPGGTRHLGHCDNGELHREQRLIGLNQGTSDWTEFLEVLEQEKAASQITNLSVADSNWQTPRSSSIFASTDFEEHARYGITYNGSKPVVNLAVISRVLGNHPEWRGQIFYDTFLKRIFSTRGKDAPEEWTDIMDSRALVWLQETFGLPNAKLEDAQRSVCIIADENQRNCLQQWLSCLQWDGQLRLTDLMTKGFGAEESQYHSRVGECWLISMVARAMEPGCKVDTLPVFEGEQGVCKSSGLGILGGAFFIECHEQITSKDFYGILSGKWLIEISEMHSFSKAEVERIKGIISNRKDRYRLPYDKYASDHPRQCVFAGTTNRDDWHNDETGGRRFWPVTCGVVNLEWLQENREQLFAEAVVRYQKGESWWDVPTDEQRRKIEERSMEDPWTEAISSYLDHHEAVSMSELLKYAVDKQIEHQTQNDTRRAASILRRLGYENKPERQDGSKRRIWRKRKA